MSIGRRFKIIPRIRTSWNSKRKIHRMYRKILYIDRIISLAMYLDR
jgi:hypothetical protein